MNAHLTRTSMPSMTVLLAAALTGSMGCSVFYSHGPLFTGPDDEPARVAKAPASSHPIADTNADTARRAVPPNAHAAGHDGQEARADFQNDARYSNPFAPGDLPEQASEKPLSPALSHRERGSSGTPTATNAAFAPPVHEGQGARPIVQGAQAPWANTPGVGVFGELSGAYLGPTAFGTRMTGAENLDHISSATVGADFDPDISRDGTFIVFASTQHTDTADIYRKSVHGHTITQLTNDAGNDLMPVISPDGDRIAFASDRDGTWNIYVMNIGGGQAVQLTNDSSPQLHPSWSPDGRSLVYCSLGAASGRWELWAMDALNPAVRHFLGYGLLPDWSPTGDKIVFQRSRQRGDRLFGIWTIDYTNGEGANPTEIVSSPVAACVNPSFSPDGKRIAFAVVPNPDHESNGRPDVADLWISNLDGTGRANLTGGLFVNLMPTWGGDERIYFISNRSGADNIWALRPDRAILAAQGPGSANGDLAEGELSTPSPATPMGIATVPDDGGN